MTKPLSVKTSWKNASDDKNSVLYQIKNWFDYNIGALAPAWLTNLVNKVANHPGTPWFFLGSGIEALGITIQFAYFDASYPIADFIVGFALFALVAWWQARKMKEVVG